MAKTLEATLDMGSDSEGPRLVAFIGTRME